MKIRSNAKQVLMESYREVEGDITFREYVVCESQSDPGFFRWLFCDSNIDDFGDGISTEEKDMYDEFLGNL